MAKHDLKKQFKIVLAILDDSICPTFDVDAQKTLNLDFLIKQQTKQHESLDWVKS